MFDPTTLGDPLAQQTQWTPLVPGGANFTTHTLHEHPQGLEYRKNAKTMAFGGVFLLVGLAVTFGAPFSEWWLLLLGLPFLGVGAYVMWPTKVLFDRARASVTVKSRAISFRDIAALQLITERVDGDDSADYDSHELNLVLSDGTRLNLVDHAGKQVLRDDLVRLRALVGCRAWDATAR